MGIKGKKSFGQKLSEALIPNAKDSKQRKMGKYITWIAAIVVIAGIITTVVLLQKDKAPTTENSSNQSSEVTGDSSTGDDAADVPVVETDANIDPATGIHNDLLPLYQSNKEVIGRIIIPDTKLDYPVMQSKDNAYYLDNSIEKKHDPWGVPFADFRATLTPNLQSTNMTIYGHAKDDGTFFQAVKEYKDIEFYKKHPVLEFNTIYGKGKYKVVALFMENVNAKNKDMFPYHDFVDMSDDAHFNSFVDNVKKRSYFNTNVDINTTDKFVTLSTCDTEVNKNDFRIVLVARKIRPDESETVDVATATENKEMLMPALWVSKKGRTNPYVK